jgi:teichuronic acid exporter
MLKNKAKNAVIWSGADIFMRHGLQFGISIALARLLSPDEFGTIALMFFFTSIANAFIDGGFSSALIQRQDVNHTDESTVFWFNLAMGATMALGLLIAGPEIAKFYARPILEPLAAVMAANVFLSALSSIHATLLTKRLDFHAQMKAGLLATLLSGCVALVMAIQGFGVWALASQTLAATTVTCISLWVFNPWRPSRRFSLTSVHRLFCFGGYMMVAAFLEIFFSRIYTLLIGRFFGVRALGLYERAESTMHLPIGILTSIFSRVAFPIFSETAHNKENLRQGARLAIRVMMLINVPAMLGLAVVAEPLVFTLFGPQWLPAVPVLQVLCLGGIFWPLHVVNLNILAAQGYSKLFFRLEVAKKMLGLTLLLSGSWYGIIGIAWGQVIFGVAAFFLNAYYTNRFLAYGAIAQIRDLISIFIASLTMAIAVHFLSFFWHIYNALDLLIVVIFGGIFFWAMVIIAKIEAVRDIIRIAKMGPKIHD